MGKGYDVNDITSYVFKRSPFLEASLKGRALTLLRKWDTALSLVKVSILVQVSWKAIEKEVSIQYPLNYYQQAPSSTIEYDLNRLIRNLELSYGSPVWTGYESIATLENALSSLL